VDNYSLRHLDRYAEQIGDTLFAKAREFTVFEWSAMTRPFETGDRAEREKLPTTFNFSEMTNGASAPTWARVAGYSLAKADKFWASLAIPSVSPVIVHSRGILYVWTMPDNFTDLYALPSKATRAIKNYVMRGFPVRLDGPAQAALFAYDNGAFIVQNYSATAADVKISTLGNSTKLKNIVTGEMIEGTLPSPHGWNWRNENSEDRISFVTRLPPHSYSVFVPDKAAQANAR
jgi:hypothetical protein